jgi:ribonuclease R
MNITKRELLKKVKRFLERCTEPVTFDQIAKELVLSEDTAAFIELSSVLQSLVSEGIVVKDKKTYYIPIGQPSELEGILQITGFERGVVTITNSDLYETILVKDDDLQMALHGDTVSILVKPHKKIQQKKVFGEIISVLQRSKSPMIGTIEYDGENYYFVPDSYEYYYDFLIPEPFRNGAKEGETVTAEFLQWHSGENPQAQIISVPKRTTFNPSLEFAKVRREYSLNPTFSEIVQKQAEIAAKKSITKELKQRIDLRNELIITIDPDDAKDFDDALSFKLLDNNLRELGVHIADVSAYVEEYSELDEEALRRGNSTYLVDGVVPMLPEILSNNVCSLVPNQDRLAFSVFMIYSENGEMLSYRIAETVINSKRRYTYAEVQTIIETKVGDNTELIHSLYDLSLQLRTNRYKTGGIDFESTELKFVLDSAGYPTEVVPKTGSSSTKLVEECMLAANKAVAIYCNDRSKELEVKGTLPYLYRVHDEPDKEKLDNAISFIRAFGISVPKRPSSSKEINAIIKLTEHLEQKKLFHQILLRSQAKAVYSEFSTGHYGLGFDEYSHFTSPIRRYPDLVVHRRIKEYMQGMPTKPRLTQLKKLVKHAASQCSLTERSSVEAERSSIKTAQVLLAYEHIGEEFEGVITGVVAFGLFIQLTSLFVEGMIHVRALRGDYYIFDERNYRLIGRDSRKIYSIGTKLKVRLIHVNVTKREVDLELLGVIDEKTS